MNNNNLDDLDERGNSLQEWLSKLIGKSVYIKPLGGDASFRRYFRAQINHSDYPTSLILMDAPPHKENSQSFVDVAEIFSKASVNSPKIVFSNLTKGFLALTDFGDITYEEYLKSNAHSANELYNLAFNALIKIQKIETTALPNYSSTKMLEELNLFPQWFLKKHLQISFDADKLIEVFNQLIIGYLAQSQVVVHRDYHIRNLMVVLENDINSEKTPGVLDFQDAVIGPITYDAVSLLRDAYIEHTPEQSLDWLIRYWENALRAEVPVNKDFSEFYRDFDFMVLLRHIKVLGIFARLNYRDGKSRYLEYLPLVFKYCRDVVCRYRELKYLEVLFESIEDKILDSKNQTKVGYTL